MDTRVAVISIIVEDSDSIETLNQLLYDARDHIIGRMGIPYREKGISIISIAIDAPTGYHQCSFRKDRPSQRRIHQDRIFQCDHTYGGKT